MAVETYTDLAVAPARTWRQGPLGRWLGRERPTR